MMMMTTATGGRHYSLLSICLLFLLSLHQVLATGPSFDVPIVNVTVVAGQTAVLPCSINRIGEYKVAWTNLEGKTFTYQQERVIDDNRVSVLRPYTKEWNLQIWNVKYADQGEYRCTLNTDPVMSKVVMLYVKVPSKIIDELSSDDVTVEEGETVVLVCNVTGVPKPEVKWYRRKASSADVPRERMAHVGEMIIIQNVSRYCDDEYECVAYNDVQPAVSRTITVTVEFKPEIYMPNKRISQSPGKFTILECRITAYPLSEMYWEKNGKRISNSHKYRIDNYDDGEHTNMFNLQLTDISREDYGAYKCVAKNRLGRDEKIMFLEVPKGYKEKASTASVDVRGIIELTTKSSIRKPPKKDPHKQGTQSPGGNKEKKHEGEGGVAGKVTSHTSKAKSNHPRSMGTFLALTISTMTVCVLTLTYV